MSFIPPAAADQHDGDLRRPILVDQVQRDRIRTLLERQKPRRRVAVPSHAQRIAADFAAGRCTVWTPDTIGEAWRAFCWRHRWARTLNDLAGTLVIGALLLFVLYALVTPAIPVGR
jgi:hypothetical protein